MRNRLVRTSSRGGNHINNHNNNKHNNNTHRQRLSDTSRPPVVEEEEIVTAVGCAQDLARLGEQSEAVLQDLAQSLSPSARQQVARLVQYIDTPKTVSVPEPPYKELRAVAINTAIPFVGFGIMDNAILIIAGDAIDTSLGVVLGISTMCAAAIANIISDVAGIMLGTLVEDFCAKYLNLVQPNLTSVQRQLRSVRFANQFGCAVGLVVGCIIGMFPLLFIDSHKIQARKREAAMDSIFQDVVTEAGDLIGAERTCLFLLVNKDKEKKTSPPIPTPEGKYLYAKYDALAPGKHKQLHRMFPLGRGIVSRAALTGESVNIYDVRTEPEFASEIGGHDSNDRLNPDLQIRNMVCVPVLDGHGRAIAVIQAINKVGKGRADTEEESALAQRSFTNSDVQILKALASHISVSLQRMYEAGDGENAELRLKDTIRMLKDYGLAGITEEQHAFKRRRPLFPGD
jgi:putative methionine-R-sulfoxide reductase with GAF domain/uncharacterized membrane-anchored protein YhcB (DUF1043 family)